MFNLSLPLCHPSLASQSAPIGLVPSRWYHESRFAWSSLLATIRSQKCMFRFCYYKSIAQTSWSTKRDYTPLWGCPVSLLSGNRRLVARKSLRVHKIPTGCCHSKESVSLNVFGPNASDDQRATKCLGGPTNYSVRDSRGTPSRRLGHGSGRPLTWHPSRRTIRLPRLPHIVLYYSHTRGQS